jgi:putative membrane protein
MPRVTFIRYWRATEPEWDRVRAPWIVRIAVRWVMIIVGMQAAEAVVNEIYEPDRFFIDGWEPLLVGAAIFMVVRAVLRPVLLFLGCVLQVITLGLFIFVVNALILILTEQAVAALGLGYEIDGLAPAFLGALVISGVSFLLSRLLRWNPLAGYRLT